MIEDWLINIGLAEWVADAVADSVSLLPFLFIIFLFIEIFEYYFSGKINSFLKVSRRSGPIIASLISLIPQCGFSVLASTLYVRKFITRGTVIAVYLATSDEAIPLLLANPQAYKYILPLVFIKVFIAIIAGFLTDFIFKSEIRQVNKNIVKAEKSTQGCCHHEVMSEDKKNLWMHPIKHTLNIFVFIFIITLVLNFLFDETSIQKLFQQEVLLYELIQPVITSIIGLIPNCAVSLALTVMLIKGTISFGAAVAGLLSNGGLGLLVLARINNLRDNFKIVIILLTVSIISGEIISLVQYFHLF